MRASSIPHLKTRGLPRLPGNHRPMKHEHLTVARLFHALPFSKLRILKFQCLLARWSKRGSTRCPSSLLPSTSMISIPVYPPSCGRSRSHPAATLDSVAEEEGCCKRQETTIACAGKRSYLSLNVRLSQASHCRSEVILQVQAQVWAIIAFCTGCAEDGRHLGIHSIEPVLRGRMESSTR